MAPGEEKEQSDEGAPLGGVFGALAEIFVGMGVVIYRLLFGEKRTKEIATEKQVVLIGGMTLGMACGLIFLAVGYATGREERGWYAGVISLFAVLLLAFAVVKLREKRKTDKPR
jgi:4-hydroxybenzoate polyprenyltransferase